MPNAVTDDGSATNSNTLRAAARLWSPEDAPPAEPPAAAPAPTRKPKSSKTPPAASVLRDRYNPILKDLPPGRASARAPPCLRGAGADGGRADRHLDPHRQRRAQRCCAGRVSAFHVRQHSRHCDSVCEQLAAVKGLGTAKAAQIKAAIEFGNRLALFSEEGRPSIGGPQDVSNLLMPELRYQKKEHLKSILLNTKNKVLAIKTVSVGDLSSSIVHPAKSTKTP